MKTLKHTHLALTTLLLVLLLGCSKKETIPNVVIVCEDVVIEGNPSENTTQKKTSKLMLLEL